MLEAVLDDPKIIAASDDCEAKICVMFVILSHIVNFPRPKTISNFIDVILVYVNSIIFSILILAHKMLPQKWIFKGEIRVFI